MRTHPLVCLLSILSLASFTSVAQGTKIRFVNPGFEQGLKSPWGTGQYAARRPVWWNAGGCRSRAFIDWVERHSGQCSLYILNRSRRKSNVYGTTQRPFNVIPNRRFRISVWAKASNLASDGGVQIAVGPKWKVQPIRLPKGTYGWTRFAGEFSLKHANGQIRILSTDRGEVWLDDLSIEFVGSVPRGTGPATTARRSPARQQRTRSGIIAESSMMFQRLGVTDYRKALRKYASQPVRDRVGELDKIIWPHSSPVHGWSYFLNLAVLGVADGGDWVRPLVTYYNPWCDVVLITQWEVVAGEGRIRDVEVVMGDVLRSGGFPTEPVPAWLRGGYFPPIALSIVAGKSIVAVERRFKGVDIDLWRDQLQPLREARLRKLNYQGVASLLLNSMKRLQELHQASPHSLKSLVDLKKHADRFIEIAAAGRMTHLLQEAKKTDADTAKILRTIGKDTFRDLTLVNYATSKKCSFAFLAPVRRRGYCIALMIRRSPGGSNLQRIFLVSYQQAYQFAKGHMSQPTDSARLPVKRSR